MEELLRRQSSAVSNHPSCIWGLLQFFNFYQHLHKGKMIAYRRHLHKGKMIAYMRHGNGRRAKRTKIPKSKLNVSSIVEEQDFLEGEANFLESSLPGMYSMNNWVYKNTVTRYQVNGNTSPEGANANLNSPPDLFADQRNKIILEEVNDLAGSSTPEPKTGPPDMISHTEQMKIDPIRADNITDRASASNSPEMFSATIGIMYQFAK